MCQADTRSLCRQWGARGMHNMLIGSDMRFVVLLAKNLNSES